MYRRCVVRAVCSLALIPLLAVRWMPTVSMAAPWPPLVEPDSSVPRLEIWTEPGLEAERAWVEERKRAILGPSSPGSESVVRVELRGEPYHYRIRIELIRRGERLADQPEEVVCECASDEMLERVGAAIAAGAQELERAEREEREAREAREEREEREAEEEHVEEPVDVAPKEPVPAPKPQRGVDARRQKLSDAGIGGLVAVTLGSAMAAVGVPLMVRKSSGFLARNRASELSPADDAAISLTILGGLALCVGIPLLIFGVKHKPKRSVAVLPVVGSSQAGMVWTRRF